MDLNKVVDKISEKAMKLIEEYIVKIVADYKQKNSWEKAIKKACIATEGIDEKFTEYLIGKTAVQRHFIWLISNKPLDNIYYSFIITIAVEMCTFDTENRFALSFAEAVLDNWFESFDKNYTELKKEINSDEIVQVIGNRERLYREYFNLYNDPLSKDIIRVYYPKNGESWISWDKNCCIDIKTNLSKGTEYGFCRIGFSYSRVQEHGNERFLKIAYVSDNKEIFRFEHDNLLKIDEKKILWAM